MASRIIVVIILLFSFSCSEINKRAYDKDDDINIINFYQKSNTHLSSSNKAILKLLQNDSCSIEQLKLLKLYSSFNKEVCSYFNGFRNDFLFELEGGDNTFFIADTLNLHNLKNANNTEFVVKYVQLSMGSLTLEKDSLEKRINLFPSNKFHFKKQLLIKLIDDLKKADSAYSVLKKIEEIENYYLINLNILIVRCT